MKKDPTIVIHFLLDDSGSMRPRQAETIQAVNDYIKDRKKESRNDVLFMLTAFGSPGHLKLIRDKIVDEVEDINSDEYTTASGTALLDSVAKSIKATEERVKEMKINPSILFVTLTDGQELNSVEYGINQVLNLIEEKKKENNWTFVFLGADASAWSVGASLGINNTAQYDVNDLKRTIKCASANTSAYYGNVLRSSSAGESYSTANFFDASQDGVLVDPGKTVNNLISKKEVTKEEKTK